MKATKANKVYTISESQEKSYIDAGFDIISDTGDVIKYGRGKTVAYDEYEALKKELEELRAGKPDKKNKGRVEVNGEPEKEGE